MNDAPHTETVLRSSLRELADDALPERRLDAILRDDVHFDAPPERKRVGRSMVAAAAAVMVLLGGLVVLAQRDGDPAPVAAPIGPRIDWTGEHVRFTAERFSIDVDGSLFSAADAKVDVDTTSFEGDQTLELNWEENGVDMRWYLYFRTDGTEWWVDEMATYNGRENGDWVTFDGDFFRSPLGTPFTGDVDLTATEDGATSRLRVEQMSIEPYTENVVLQDAPIADGAPPPLPAGIALTGVSWTPTGSLVLGYAQEVLMTECVIAAGYDVPEPDVQSLVEGIGQWNPDLVLGIGSEAGAAAFGYHLGDRVADLDQFARSLPEAERRAFFETLNGGDDVVPVPVTLPDGTATGMESFRGGCSATADAAFDGMILDQEGLRQVVQETGIDQEAVSSSTARDGRVIAALAEWRECVGAAVGAEADTPDDLARQFAFDGEQASGREIEVAVADARCQADLDLQTTVRAVYAEYQRFALGDQAPLFDQLTVMRTDIIERAEQILADRGLAIPTLD